MSHIIGSKCVDVKDGACIEACPVDCIYESIEQITPIQHTSNPSSPLLKYILAT
jgi:NAD-dependent dihydropyrimidine dehydrogenase PreA subunit